MDYGKEIADFLLLTTNPNNKTRYCISFDVIIKEAPNNKNKKLNSYDNFVDITDEYDREYLKSLSLSVDESDNIKVVYESLIKYNISNHPSIQTQLAEFLAIEREYKLKQLTDTF